LRNETEHDVTHEPTTGSDAECARSAMETYFALVLARVQLAVARRSGLSTGELELRTRAASVAVDAVGDGPAMSQLRARFGLTSAQVRFFWYAAAFSSSSAVAVHAEALGGPLLRRGLNAAVFGQLSAEPEDLALATWLASNNTLLSNGLLEVGDRDVTVALRTFSVPARVVDYLRGSIYPEHGAAASNPAAIALFYDGEQQRALAEIASVLGAPSSILVLEGPPSSGRRTAIAHATSRPIHSLSVPDRKDQFENAFAALRREACLADGLSVVANAEHLVDSGASEILARFLRESPGPVALTSSRAGLDLGVDRPVVRVRWPTADTTARRQLWVSAAGDACAASTEELDELAMRYRVGPGTIQRAVASARLIAGTSQLDVARLRAGLRHNISERMGELARRVEVKQTWEDAVLPEDILSQVKTFVSRVRHAHQVFEEWRFSRTLTRGDGAAALFSGPPGTGKTMVAGLIARELDLELYQVDLGQVVSKWVGETPKHLGRIFDAAEEGHALLLFDEADALFGQRSSEVKSAVDRYGNLEVNYILQRIEAFGGVTILTTNLDSAIDPALKRRLAEHIRFVPPDEDDRERLWQRMLSTGAAPIGGDVDVGRLGRDFKMTGANIRNAVLAAAFLAAAESSTITQDHLLRAARAEYRSMGHVLSDTGPARRGGSLS
jgi:AAA+ superfamily predicted ATPase